MSVHTCYHRMALVLAVSPHRSEDPTVKWCPDCGAAWCPAQWKGWKLITPKKEKSRGH